MTHLRLSGHDQFIIRMALNNLRLDVESGEYDTDSFTGAEVLALEEKWIFTTRNDDQQGEDQ